MSYNGPMHLKVVHVSQRENSATLFGVSQSLFFIEYAYAKALFWTITSHNNRACFENRLRIDHDTNMKTICE